MIQIRRSQDRGHFDDGWLKTYHTFSFAEYRDPKHIGFRTLRVINEDWIAAGQGFPPHSHQNMEIITYILEGALAHQDSMGNSSVIVPGEVQRMSAGSGVTHSEFNHSANGTTHLLQIWIRAERKGIDPGYEQKKFSDAGKTNKLRLVVSRDGRDGSVTIHQDVELYDAALDAGKSLVYEMPAARHAWIQVTQGKIEANSKSLNAGDGAAVSEEKTVRINSPGKSSLLLFDLS